MSNSKDFFHFKKFYVRHQNASMKVGTDAVLLGSWASLTHAPQSILDIGTGCGLIALMLAQRFPKTPITGIDIHEPSIEEAQYNAQNFPLENNLTFIHQEYLSYQPEKLFELIVSNPPFFTNDLQSPIAKRNGARHQIHLTFEQLLKKSSSILSPNGALCLISPVEQMNHFIQLAPNEGFSPVRICRIYSYEQEEPVRILGEFKKETSQAPIIEKLVIYHRDRTYTESYKRLTKDFYLKF